jgi:anti-sigma-K factor RskA
MMAHSEDHIALAAEYALGTLDAAERAQVEAMMAVDADFTAMVQAWEQRLSALNQMVGSVEPRAEVWEKIRTAVGLSAPVQPQAPIAQEADRPAATADTSNVIRISAQAEARAQAQAQAQVRRWRNVATIATAIAAALVAMIVVGAYQPDLLPDRLRPKPQTQVAEVNKTPSTPAPPASAQYAAVLQKDGGSPAFILTVDGATKNFTVRKVGATAPDPGKSFELWLISDKLPQPRSLGVIGGGDFTARALLASYDADIVKAATYAVTVEQAGGSPDGNPHSAPVFTGKLIETVPPR